MSVDDEVWVPEVSFGFASRLDATRSVWMSDMRDLIPQSLRGSFAVAGFVLLRELRPLPDSAGQEESRALQERRSDLPQGGDGQPGSNPRAGAEKICKEEEALRGPRALREEYKGDDTRYSY